MNIIKRAIRDLSPVEYYRMHLSIVHNFFPEQLANKELETLAHFMSLEGDIVDRDRFGTQARKIVMERMNIKPGGLGNYLRFLREKKYIYEKDGKFHINPYILSDSQQQGYQFLITKKKQ